ncbi:M64 family metallopeptidase [Kineococcus sp. SYSU DK001]|uniref:M64 family metallopeptidase n=1 Tax=Kineococcus sp. SYSU DK001 TaxID=3383122 RepID=UPI003D7DCF18
MGTADGTVTGSTKVVDHGADADRYVFAVMGDGFTAAEQPAFQTACTGFTTALQATRPFDAVWNQINVHRIDIESHQSGADNPLACGDGSAPTGGATTADTYLDARYCGDGSIRRLLTVDSGLAQTTANARVPGWDVIVVIVNHAEYGGSGGGKVAVYSVAADALEVALHELGHSAYGLADEYEYYQGCSSGETDHDTYTGPEPGEPNVTAVSDRSTLKWRHLVASATPVPTTTNPDCTTCDTQANPVGANDIGAFAGAKYFHCGLYRPAHDCLMRTVGSSLPFCAVCQEAIKAEITRGSSPACFVASAVYADTTHPDVVWLRDWRDRRLRPGARGRTGARALVAVYGRVGPPAARHVQRHPALARLLRDRVLGPAVGLARRHGRRG